LSNKQILTRRQFVKSTAAGAVAIYSVPSAAIALNTVENDSKAGGKKSRVVKVSHAGLINPDDSLNKKNAGVSIDKALLLLTGAGTMKDAWMQIFPGLKPEDTIGLKVNAINRKCPAHPEVAYSIATSLIDSLGVNPNNIIIWDRTTSELKKAGYIINKSDTGIRCFGTVEKFSIARWVINSKQEESGGIGYDTSQPVDVGGGRTSNLSKILTTMCTYLINVPVLKDHGEAGVTLSLKNHYGTIDNPRDCHSNYCDPFVAKMNQTPQIREKTKLIICDAVFGIYKGGPLGAPQWQERAILASTDPVALDYTGLQIINEKRRQNGKDPVTKKAIHIKTAMAHGLGTCDPEQINLEEVSLA
jgi:uncharacterized protein (DUF362 family)